MSLINEKGLYESASQGLDESEKERIRTAPSNSIEDPFYVQLIENSNSDLGWRQFNDTEFTEESPRTIPANTRTKITIDALSGVSTNAPDVSVGWWNSGTQKFMPDSSGDFYVSRLSFIADPTLNNRNLTLELDIGGSFGTIWSKTVRLARGAGVDTQIAENINVYTLGTFVANGGEFYVTCDGEFNLYTTILILNKVFKA